ncbi:MAG TPA: outer membrane lipoprotein-sorting protein [Kofleriaceae bacterium]
MKSIVSVFVVAFVVAFAAPRAGADELGDLVHKADMVYRGKSSASVFDMTIKLHAGERVYKVIVWSENGEEDRVLIKLLGPALWRGFGTLKLGNSLKIYDPKSNHVTVVSHSMLGDSWMGSHFSNDDLVKETRLDRDYQIKSLATDTRDTDLGFKATYHTLELTPTPRAPVVWGRIVYELWAHDDAAVPVKVTYYRKAEDRTPARTITFTQVREFDGRLVPATLQVTVTDKPGEFTRIDYEKLKFNVRIDPQKFTEQALMH